MSIVHVSSHWAKSSRWVEVGGWAIASYKPWAVTELKIWDLYSSRLIATLPYHHDLGVNTSKLLGAKGRNRLVRLSGDGIQLYDFDSKDRWSKQFVLESSTHKRIRWSILQDASFWGEDENHLFIMTRDGWYLVSLGSKTIVRSLDRQRLYDSLDMSSLQRRIDMNRPFGWTAIGKNKSMMVLHFRHTVMRDVFVLWNLENDEITRIGKDPRPFYHGGELVRSVTRMDDGRLLSWSGSSILLWDHHERWTNDKSDIVGKAEGDLTCLSHHKTKVVAASYCGMIRVYEARSRPKESCLALLYVFDSRKEGLMSCFRQGNDPFFWLYSEKPGNQWITLDLQEDKLSMKPPLQPSKKLYGLPSYHRRPSIQCWSSGGVKIDIRDGVARFDPPKPPSPLLKDLREELIDYFYAPPYGPAYLDLKEANKDLFT